MTRTVLAWCRTCRTYHGPVTGPCPPTWKPPAAEPPCPDCGAAPGRSCYPDCPRYAEGARP